jgi:hypothetical protein
MACEVRVEMYQGLERIIIENSRVVATLLPGKGADLLAFIWKATNTNCLYRSDTPIESLAKLDLQKQRLRNHSDYSLGGWMEALPHRGSYQGFVLEQDNGGIAATLPWEYMILKVSKDEAAVKVWVDLPIFPLRIEKIYKLTEREPEVLAIAETVVNIGSEQMDFTWTQHALFGGEFLDGDVKVAVPSNSVFKAWEHIDCPGKALSAYEEAVAAVHLRQGCFDLRRALPKGCGDYEFVVYNSLEAGCAALINEQMGLAVELHFELEHFPYLRALYQHTEAGNVIGMEPSDDLFSGWEYSKKHGTYTSLAKGECINTKFSLAYREIIKEDGRKKDGVS